MERLIQWSWQVPFGELSLKIDPLSILFLTSIGILVLSAGIYGMGYLQEYRNKKALGIHVFFYFLITIALALVVTANNVILFLGAWEVMAISSYFLIVFHDEKPSACRAGLLYLVATHCGTFCLFGMFFLMAHIAGSMNFDVIAQTHFSPGIAGIIFVLALFGFGVKAGIFPLHIWLPHAHPAAPSYVSALLSGVVIKTGIYGLCRLLWMVPGMPVWCGYVLLLLGVASGVMGVLYALGQHELKKLLAYHSIENIGIIILGMSLGMLGRAYHVPFLEVVGFSGALLHVFNHSLFKGLLFLGAGAVIQRTHTGEMDQLGGLAKIMPRVSILFLIGALAICGLPLFNGFISEFIIFFGLFQGALSLPLHGAVICALGILSLALMGALALACFTKVYGTIFLGQSRKPLELINRKETSAWMLIPMVVLAGLCIWIGLFPTMMVQASFLGGQYLTRVMLSELDVGRILIPLGFLIHSVLFFLVVFGILFIFRRILQKSRPIAITETWSCGYGHVTSRFQYTSSSFARSIVDLFKRVLFLKRERKEVKGDFPNKSQLSSSVHDASEEFFFHPLLIWLTNISRRIDMNRMRYTQMYLMYIFLFLIFLLVWKLK